MSTVAELQQQLETERIAHKETQLQLDEVKNKLSANDSLTPELCKNIETLLNENRRLRLQNSSSQLFAHEPKGLLNNEIEEKNLKIQFLEAENAAKSLEIEDLTKKVEELDFKNLIADSAVHRLTESETQWYEAFYDKSVKVYELEGQIKNLNLDLDSAKTKINSLDRDVKYAEWQDSVDLEEAKVTIEDLQLKWSFAETDLKMADEAYKRCDSLENKVKELEAELAAQKQVPQAKPETHQIAEQIREVLEAQKACLDRMAFYADWDRVANWDKQDSIASDDEDIYWDPVADRDYQAGENVTFHFLAPGQIPK